LITLNVHQQESCCKTNYFALPFDGVAAEVSFFRLRERVYRFSSEAGFSPKPPFSGNLMCGIAATIVGFVTSEVTW
jgi:hypothetical protein